MPIQTNLTQAKAIAEAKRVAKLEADIAVYGGQMTTLAQGSDETARAAIITASTTMQSNIQAATTVAELSTYMTQMD